MPSDETIGDVLGGAVAGIVGLSAIKMIGDSAKGNNRNTSNRPTSNIKVPKGFKSKKQIDGFLDVWYRNYPMIYSKYHTLHKGNARDMIGDLWGHEKGVYNKIKAQYDNLR